jgi:hypothetical protein
MRRYRPVLALAVAAMTATVITAPTPLIAASQAQNPPNHGEDVSGFVVAAVGDLVPIPTWGPRPTPVPSSAWPTATIRTPTSCSVTSSMRPVCSRSTGRSMTPSGAT